MPKILCITGTDGCGKSSVAAKLQDLGCIVVGHKSEQLGQDYDFASKMIGNINQNNIATKFSQNLILSYFQTIAVAKMERALELANKYDTTVILEDYYYKWVAREIVRGNISEDMSRHYFQHVQKPDLVVVLSRNLASCAASRDNLNRLEYLNTPSDFCGFQSEVYQKILGLIDRPKVVVENNGYLDVAVSQILKMVGSYSAEDSSYLSSEHKQKFLA